MEEKKFDLNSLIGFVLLGAIMIYYFYTNQPTPEQIAEKKAEQVQDSINKLSPVSYFKMSRSQYNGEEDNNDLSYEYGLIAQELEEVLKETDPENTVVTKGDDGLLGVSYMQLVMPLIKSVQELSSYVEELESNKSDEIQALKKEIELLKSMIKSQK